VHPLKKHYPYDPNTLKLRRSEWKRRKRAKKLLCSVISMGSREGPP